MCSAISCRYAVTSVDGFASTAFGGFEGRPTPCLGHVSLDVIQGGEAHVQDGCCRGPGYIKVANDGESVTSTDGTNAAVTVRSPSGGRLALVVARRDVLVGPLGRLSCRRVSVSTAVL